MSRDDLLHDLTLAMLYLTSWEEKGPGGPVRRAWKGYDWGVIDRLDSDGLISTSHRAKSAYLSDEACRQAEGIVARLEEAWGRAGGNDVLLAQRPLGVRALRFRVELRLWPGHPCWREIVLPALATFADLHDAIQSAFLWWDYHLHRFELRTRGEDVEIMNAREIAEFEEEWGAGGSRPRRVDSARLLLSDVFPRTRKARYFYDYGDGWEHDIRLVEAIDSYDGELPACTAGAGDAPPEDVAASAGSSTSSGSLATPAIPSTRSLPDGDGVNSTSRSTSRPSTAGCARGRPTSSTARGTNGTRTEATARPFFSPGAPFAE